MTSDKRVEAEIRAKIAAEAELQTEFNDFISDVVSTWRSYSPVDSGRYAASVGIVKRFRVGGLPAATVGSLSNRAHLIEYGTGEDKKVKDQAKKREDGRRYVRRLGALVGPDTPTPAFAPRALTVAHFGGDETPVRDVMENFGTEYSRDEAKAALKPYGQTIAYLAGEQ